MKFIKALEQEFESDSVDTPQFLRFYKDFKSEFTKFLKTYSDEIEIHKGHFEISGFFKMRDNGKIFYFSLGDVRWFKQNMLLRTAESFKDFRGGRNEYVENDRFFEENFISIIKN